MNENKWHSDIEVCVRQYEPLIEQIAGSFAKRERHRGYHVDVEDLKQVARTAVMRAHKNCDRNRRHSFDAFARSWMNGECTKWCRKQRLEAAFTNSEFHDLCAPESPRSSDEQREEDDAWDRMADQAGLTALEKRVIELRRGVHDPSCNSMSQLQVVKKLRTEGWARFGRCKTQSEISLVYMVRQIELRTQDKLERLDR